MVYHENRPVALRENIYRIITRAHLRAQHGGRDKTSTRVKHNYSWSVSPFPYDEYWLPYSHYSSGFQRILLLAMSEPVRPADEDGENPMTRRKVSVIVVQLQTLQRDFLPLVLDLLNRPNHTHRPSQAPICLTTP